MSLGPHTITVVHPTTATQDGFGNSTPDWAGATTTVETGWGVQPLTGPEVIIGRDVVVSKWQCFGPPESVLTATDRVIFDGDTYEVDGDVQRWGFTPLGHVTCLLLRSQAS